MTPARVELVELAVLPVWLIVSDRPVAKLIVPLVLLLLGLALVLALLVRVMSPVVVLVVARAPFRLMYPPVILIGPSTLPVKLDGVEDEFGPTDTIKPLVPVLLILRPVSVVPRSK